MLPAFRHGADTPWGGDALRKIFGKDIPDDRTGESLEVSALPGLISRDETGAGLDELIARHGRALTGSRVGEPFPLLLKLIDARDRLSVQTHPDDAYAAAHENGKLGKTEAWVILAAKPGARLIYGLAPDCGVRELRAALDRAGEQGAAERVAACFKYEEVKPGDVFYIPSGTIHAIGEGILLYEIQQSSDVTYRLWDWMRTDARGGMRDLHIDHALAVHKHSRYGGALSGAAMPFGTGSRTLYIADDNFALERLTISGGMRQHPDGSSFSLLTPLGNGRLIWENGSLPFAPGDTLFIPASAPIFDIQGNLDILKSYVPDRPALRAELGALAERVAGLMDDV
jgi:mannose-6-phosphate isomerase